MKNLPKLTEVTRFQTPCGREFDTRAEAHQYLEDLEFDKQLEFLLDAVRDLDVTALREWIKANYVKKETP